MAALTSETSSEIDLEYSEQSEWISMAREKLSGFLGVNELAQHFQQLKKCLQKARYSIQIAESPTLADHNKDIEDLFYKVCELSVLFYDCVEKFEDNCRLALRDAKRIKWYLQNGYTKVAVNKIGFLQRLSSRMVDKSAEVLCKIDSLSLEVRKVVTKTCDRQSCGVKQKNDLASTLDQMENELKEDRLKLKRALEEFTNTKEDKELHEKELVEASKGSNLESVFKRVKSCVISIMTFLSVNLEFQQRDLKPKLHRVKLSAAAHAEAEMKKQKVLKKVSDHDVKKRKIEKNISGLDMILKFLQESTTILNKLSVSMFSMSSFWKHVKECCSHVSDASSDESEMIESLEPDDLEKSEIIQSLEPDHSKKAVASIFLKYPGVEKSLGQFTDLWQVLKEMFSTSKEELKTIKDDLQKAFTTNPPSREEAEAYLQANTSD